GLAEWNGGESRPARLDAANIRLDQRLGSRLSLFGRFIQAPSSNEFGAFQVNRLDLGATSATAALTFLSAGGILVDIRANYSLASARSVWGFGPGNECPLQDLAVRFQPDATCASLVRFTIAGAGTVVSGPEGEWRQRQKQLVAGVGGTIGK